MLIAGKSSILGFAYVLISSFVYSFYVKIAMTRRQSAEVKKTYAFLTFQRLHAKDLIYAYLVGLFEEDRFFSISKKKENI